MRPAVIVPQLFPKLPERYIAALRVYFGYEVRIYDAHHGWRLVAAMELVSPSNYDRPEHRWSV